jgi:hypothetical protein
METARRKQAKREKNQDYRKYVEGQAKEAHSSMQTSAAAGMAARRASKQRKKR